MQPAADLDDLWTATERDVPRRLRLALGGVVAAVAMVSLASGLAALPRGVTRAAVEEEPLEVALVEVPDEPPPPEPEPPPVVEAAAAPGPRLARVESPVEVPKEAPPEKEPTGAPEAGGGDPTEGPSGGGGTASRGPGLAAPPPPTPPPPPPPPAAPMRVTDDVEPPKPLAMASPSYPSAAKSAGVEGTVVVSYVVSEAGAVTDARVVRGPPELAEACLAAVRGWRFSPAMSGGRPVSVKRSARFPFRLRT